MLKYLSASKRFSNHFLRPFNRLLLKSLQIENINLPTIRTPMILGIFVGKNYVEMPSALAAVNHHCDWEIPFHKRVVLRANGESLNFWDLQRLTALVVNGLGDFAGVVLHELNLRIHHFPKELGGGFWKDFKFRLAG